MKVLDNGFVKLVDIMGDDIRILQSARVSTGAESIKGPEKDRGLIRYLYRNEHMTPFESVVLQFHVKVPLFVARQWHRHRTFSYNEASARYKELPNEYYDPEMWRLQGTKNHQQSGEDVPDSFNNSLNYEYNKNMKKSYLTYNNFLEKGVAREMARCNMPVSQYTEFYMTGNLRNYFHFLNLRLHEHAQYEIRVYAEAMRDILRGIEGLSWSVEIWEEMRDIDTIIQNLKNNYKNDSSTLKEKLISLL